MKPTLIVIRGSPGSGKSTLATNLTKKTHGKVALLSVDEFPWAINSNKKRDSKDYSIFFDNFLHALENYLKLGCTVIAEDAWVRLDNDKSTSVVKVVNLGKKYNANIHQFLLDGSWDTIKKYNASRSFSVPIKRLKKHYTDVYSKTYKNEVVIDIDNKKPSQILKEVQKYL